MVVQVQLIGVYCEGIAFYTGNHYLAHHIIIWHGAFLCELKSPLVFFLHHSSNFILSYLANILCHDILILYIKLNEVCVVHYVYFQ